MNKKDERIRKLWNSGLKDPAAIAKKLGLATPDRVIEGLQRLKLIEINKEA